jgi:hypothetical protein
MGKPHPGNRPITQADRDQVAALHAEGLSRNKIAGRIGRSAGTVTKIARELGLSFARANDPGLVRAQQARVADARARRTTLQLTALGNAQQLAEAMFSPVTAFNFGGKDNTYNEHELPEPSHRDKRDLAIAIQALTNSAIRLAEHDSGADLGGVVSLLDQLGRRLTAAHGNGDEEHPTDLTEEP